MRKIIITIVLTVALHAMAQINGFDKHWQFWSDRHPEKQVVSIPHDAMQTETRVDTLKNGRHNGFYPGGTYHYEKTVKVPAEWLQKHVTLEFEGVYQKSNVLINGQHAGGCVYGYTPFSICADGLLHEGENVIRVDVDNSKVDNSRWYSGAGIYRPVHMRVQEPTYIKDVKISTLSISPAIIHVESNIGVLALKKDISEDLRTKVRVEVSWGDKVVAAGEGTNICIDIPEARLWSAEEPNLYKIKVELVKDEQVIETRTHDFGIRQMVWSANGLLINGKQTLLRGGCIHHDNGIIGACEYDDAAMRKIAIMKQYGFNAIRSSHNPCSEAILRACDKLGMYVIDELWDMWYADKTPYDYSFDWDANHERDMEAIVRKDINHPSVIMYSIGNEIKEPAETRGLSIAQQLVNRMHQLDPSRAVTAGINLTLIYITHKDITWSEFFGGKQGEDNEKYYKSSELYNKMASVVGGIMMNSVRKPEIDTVTTPVLNMLDIAGYNYASSRYKIESKLHPNRIIVGSETYPYKLYDNWRDVERFIYLIGDFMWTAWDYLGEVNLGSWFNTDETPGFLQKYPSLLAGAGAIDLIGHPTGEILRAQSVWSKDDKPYLAVRPVSKLPVLKSVWRGTNSIPSWSWRSMEGTTAIVEVFTTAHKVKLYLNDSLIGEREPQKGVAEFEVAYMPGTLKAVSVGANGKEQVATLTSAKGKTQITIKPESVWVGKNCSGMDNVYKTGGLIYLDIDLTDANGIIESNADTQLHVEVKGAELLGFGSARPRTEERFGDGCYTTYYGRSQAVILADKPGNVIVTVSGKGLKTAKKTLDIR